MKKNKAMRAAGGLFIATMLSTSIVSGTYAKYVTKGSVQDEARVAAFGVYVNGTGSLFGQTYYGVNDVSNSNEPGKDSDGTIKNTDNEASLTVKSQDTYGIGNVVAPGSQNTKGITLSLTGKPEVDVAVTYDFGNIEDIYLKAPSEEGKYPDLTDANATKGFDFTGEYHPLEFTLTGAVLYANEAVITSALADEGSSAEVIKDDTNNEKTYVSGTLKDIETVFSALNGLNSGKGIIYPAGTDFDDVDESKNYTLNLIWKWEFAETPTTNRIIGEEATTDTNNGVLIDQMDTLLGDFAAISFNGATKVTDANKAAKAKQGVTVADIVGINYGFVQTLIDLKDNTEFKDDATITTQAEESAAIFKGLFGSVDKYNENVGKWLETEADSFTDKDVFTVSYDDAKNIAVPANADSDGQYWLNVVVDFTVKVTQVD